MSELPRDARHLVTVFLASLASLRRGAVRIRRGLREAGWLALAVPVLSSLPGAPVNVYLDFDGHVEKAWGNYTNIVSPPYDRDGDLKSFSQEEIESIREIWARVAEDFSPFHINVTTLDPGDYSNGRGVHVVIGGHYADWYRIRVGGVSFANSFVNSMPNVVYVFSRALGGGTPKYVADLVSHEVGHTFGLEEQSVYDETGRRLRDYNTGESKLWGPLMGNSLAAPRSIWHYGASVTARTVQDDVAIIARSENGFGFRPDDHADEASGGTAVGRGRAFRQGGVIGTLRDRDCFVFECEGGRINLRVDVAAMGPNLDAKLELRTLNGEVLAIDDPDEALNCSLAADLPQGTYCAVVASHGSYGDLGQYTLAGSLKPDPSVKRVALFKSSRPTVEPGFDEPGSAAPGVVLASDKVEGGSAVTSPVAGPATR
jgi:hypothetical protein